MKITPITTAAALALIGLGGFMAGRISAPASSEVASEGESAATKSGRSSSSRLGSSDASSSKKTTRSTKSGRGQMADSAGRAAKLEAIVRGENALERNRALLDYLDQLGPGEFEDAVAHFRSLGITEARMGEYSLLLTAWAEADPHSALAFAQANTRNSFAQDTILTTWATKDPEAAIRWAQANFSGEEANPYMAGIIRGIAGTDPTRATELLGGMPRSQERGKGLEFLLPHFLEQGADVTRDWISALGDESLKNGAIMRVADRLASTDPAGTVNWLLANPGEGAQRRMDDVYGTWARTDSAAALRSYQALPAGEARTDALRGVIGTVARDNPREALAMLDRYPGDVNDRVVRDFVWGTFGNDPSTAATQIARISDQREREQMYRRTIDAWYDRDPASASQWVQTNPVPESIRDRMNRRISGQQ